jgi:CheY-like chemotaxis protein/cytoskeletal protein CcmA (bactofilin family)
MHVLYVDDDPTMTAAVERMFTSQDFQCDTSALGETAVDLAKRNKYDIILLDVMLPDIDGYEVIKRLRTAGVPTPVLLQSGLVDRESDIDGLWLGVSDYLLKPFNKRELFDRVQAILSRPADSGPQDPVRISETSAPSDAERDRHRRHRRFETVQPGRILYNGGIDCLILNMSHGGAALQLSDPNADCPESFDLMLQSGAILSCHVRWRSADKIGVQGEALFPDEVVTDILKQGEAAVSESAPPEAAADRPAQTVASAEGPAQSLQQSTPTADSAVEAPAAPEPEPEERPDSLAPAAPQLATSVQPQRQEPATGGQRDEPEPAVRLEVPVRHVAPVAEPGPEPKVAEPAAVERPGKSPAQLPQQPPEPAAERPERNHGEQKPSVRSEDGEGDDGQVFTVDRGTRLVAETCECEQLVVDGHLEAVARARRLRLGREGRFVGSAVVETAEIRGHYEGDLTVADSLVIRAGGTVSGTTRYRKVVIEGGGALVGQVQLLPRDPQGAACIETDPQAAMPAQRATLAHA